MRLRKELISSKAAVATVLLGIVANSNNSPSGILISVVAAVLVSSVTHEILTYFEKK